MTEDSGAQTKRSGGDESYLTLLVLLNIGAQGLIGLLSPLTEELIERFGFTNNGISTVQISFLLVYAVCTPGWAYLSTRISRHRALIFVSALWGGSCLLISFATHHLLFQFGFALAAVGNAAVLPLTFSMAVDVTPPGRRGQAFGWLSTAHTLSMGLAFIVGGTLGGVGWYVPFQVFSVFALIAILCLLFWKTYEPAHGATEQELQSLFDAGELYNPRIHWTDFRILISPWSNFYYLLSNVLAMIPLGAVAFWFIPMMRRDHGFSAADATLLMIGLFLVQVPGAIVFGYLTDWLSGSRPRAKAWMLFACTLLTLPCYFIGFMIPWDSENLLSVGFFGFAGLILSGAFVACALPPLTYNCIGDINAPERRGVMFSIVNLAQLVGRAIGIQVVARLTESSYAQDLAFADAGVISLSLGYVSLFFVPAAVCLFPSIKHLVRDQNALSQNLKDYVN